MSTIKSAIVGAGISGAIAAGSLVGLHAIENSEKSPIEHCVDGFEGQSQKDCIDRVTDDSNAEDGITALAIIGGVGLVGFGYLAYKGVKEDLGTTGVIEDLT